MVHYLLIGYADVVNNDDLNNFETGDVSGFCGQGHDRSLLDMMPDFF
jgi:hypothetical protein